MPNIDLSILNQRQTPAFFADTLANRPAAGFLGRIFVSTDTFAFYRDNGTGWDLIGGPGTGTITGTGASGQIALWNGASTITGDTGLTYDGTANSLTADKFIVSGGTSSQFLKANGSVDSNSYVPYTGANASLNMGANNLLGQSYFINGDNLSSGGFLGIKQFNGSSSGSNGYTSISALQQNSLYFQFSQTNGTNKTFELSTGLLGTTIRQFLLPDADGTLALTSNILNIYNSNGTLTGERTISLNGNNLIFDGGSSIARVRMDADTNVARIFSFATNNLPRFAIRVDGTESGGNAGSDYAIRRYDDAGTFIDSPLTINRATGQSTFAKKVVIENNTGDQQLQIVGTTAPSLRIDNAQTGATKRVGIGISTATNNFIQGSADRDMCIFNGSTTASPILFGIYDTTNVQEGARISTARNLLVGTTTDNGSKLQVSGAATFSSSVTAGGTGEFSINDGSNTWAPIITMTNNSTGANDYAWGKTTVNDLSLQNINNGYYPITFSNQGSFSNVGINNISPAAILHLSVATASVNSTKGLRITNPAGTALMFECGSSNDSFVGTTSTSDFNIRTNNTQRIKIGASTGNVLIDTTTDDGTKLQVKGNVKFGAGNGNRAILDSNDSVITLGPGGTTDFDNYSGMLLVCNHNTGAFQIFVCGGGATASVYLLGGAMGTFTYNLGINGYTFTNNTASTYIYNFTAFRTRNNA